MDSKKRIARTAGLLYLLFIVTLIISTAIRTRLIVFDDPSTTFANISNSESSFRISVICELVSSLFFLLAAWALYVLLRSTGKNLALLFLLLNLAGVAIECMNMINQIAVLVILRDDNLKILQPAQLEAGAIFFLNLHKNGFMIAQIFFSTWLLPLGYLVFKSGFLPKVLGILLMLDFLFWLLYFFQYFLFPHFKELMYISFPVAFVAEVSLTFWLLIKGVKENASGTQAVI